MEDMEAAWATFTEEHAYVEKAIYADLQETAHLLAAFYAGMDGVDEAQEVFAVWVGALMGMLRQCMQSQES